MSQIISNVTLFRGIFFVTETPRNRLRDTVSLTLDGSAQNAEVRPGHREKLRLCEPREPLLFYQGEREGREGEGEREGGEREGGRSLLAPRGGVAAWAQVGARGRRCGIIWVRGNNTQLLEGERMLFEGWSATTRAARGQLLP